MIKRRLIKLTKHKEPKESGDKPTRFRTVPIKDTITHIRQLPKSAILYKCAASRYWQFRVFLEGAQRKRSTQTEDVEEADQGLTSLLSSLRVVVMQCFIWLFPAA